MLNATGVWWRQVIQRYRWRRAWSAEMRALGDPAGGTLQELADRSIGGAASQRFFRMWQAESEWRPVSARAFLTANRGQVHVAMAQPRRQPGR